MAPRSKKDIPAPASTQAIPKGKQAAGTSQPAVFAGMPPAMAKRDGSAARLAFSKQVSAMKEDPLTVMVNSYMEPRFETNSVVLDHVLGLDGVYMHGRVYMVHGEEHSGKSTLYYCMGAAYQQVTDSPIMVWDFEGACVPAYLWQCGLNPDPTYTYIRQPDNLDEVLRQTIEYIEAGYCKFFIFDSVALMHPGVSLKSLAAGKALTPPPGEQARAFKNFLRILQPIARKHDAALCFVNQQSCKIPQNNQEAQEMKYESIARPAVSINGGKAARFYPSVMLETKKGKTFESAGDKEEWLFPIVPKFGKAGSFVGKVYSVNRTKVRVLKNKLNGSGYREHNLYIRPGGGIDDWVSVRELARHYKLIDFAKGAGWFVGKADAPIATYPNKAEAILDLVVNQNMDVLVPLRVLVIEAIRKDDPRSFGYERGQREAYLAGDTDEAPAGVEVDFDDDELSADGEEEE